MKGSIQTKKGLLYVVISYKDEADKHKQKWISTGLSERGNRKNAKEILTNELEKFKNGYNESKEKIEHRTKPKELDKSMTTMLFSDFCLKYIDSIKNTLSPVCYKSYKLHFSVKIKKFFDEKKLRLIDITETEIMNFNDYLRNSGLKNSTIKHYANILRPALRQAHINKLIPNNPYDFVPVIKKEKTHIAFYDKKEMSRFLKTIEGHKLELAFNMSVYYGIRRSELLGLKWSAIDFDHKILSISHKVLVMGSEIYKSDELKTNSSHRTFPLLPEIEEKLLTHKKSIEENKKFYGNTYNSEYKDYVFVNEIGKIIYPNFISEQFKKVLEINNLKKIRFHDLRHSCASIMLANGVNMKEIQEWLGHANYSTTADVYSHLDFSSKIKSAETISKALDNNKSSQIEEQTSSHILQSTLQEMQELGFSEIEDYIEYLCTENLQKKAKDFCM